MAFLSYIKSSKTPEQRLKDAVTTNNVSELELLLNDGVGINVRLQIHGGNTALHFAASDGLTNIVETLITAGANVNILNDHGNPPLVNACLNNKVDACLKLLPLTRGDFMTAHVPSIQRAVSKRPDKWSMILDEMKMLMMKASPNVQVYCQHEHLLNIGLGLNIALVLSLDVWKLLILCGKNPNDTDIKEHINSLLNYCQSLIPTVNDNDADRDERLTKEFQKHIQFYHWMNSWRTKPQTLQHYCRMSIRQSFDGNCNVFYGVRSLVLPQSLKSYICFMP